MAAKEKRKKSGKLHINKQNKATPYIYLGRFAFILNKHYYNMRKETWSKIKTAIKLGQPRKFSFSYSHQKLSEIFNIVFCKILSEFLEFFNLDKKFVISQNFCHFAKYKAT